MQKPRHSSGLAIPKGLPVSQRASGAWQVRLPGLRKGVHWSAGSEHQPAKCLVQPLTSPQTRPATIAVRTGRACSRSPLAALAVRMHRNVAVYPWVMQFHGGEPRR